MYIYKTSKGLVIWQCHLPCHFAICLEREADSVNNKKYCLDFKYKTVGVKTQLKLKQITEEETQEIIIDLINNKALAFYRITAKVTKQN